MTTAIAPDNFLNYLSRCRIAASFWYPANQIPNAHTLHSLKQKGLDIAEIRLDLFSFNDYQQVHRLIAEYAAELPIILTVRSAAEGGKWQYNEAKRYALIKATIAMCQAVDIELAAPIFSQVLSLAQQHNTTLIASHHNFGTADTLTAMAKNATHAFGCGANIYKNASLVNTANDLTILQTFVKKWKHRPIIVTGMGDNDYARQARSSLPLLGSRIAFAAIGDASAPGQLSLTETVEALNSHK